jgi:hypothetical protein
MAFGKMTWIGLMVVALGWALLLSGASAMELLMRFTARSSIPHFDLAAITQPTILTGFGLAILGALQSGFGALNKFFDEIIARTARTTPKALVEPTADQRNIVDRGLFKDRPYVLFGDGTIEVETLLGLRRFASLQDVNEFIGA